PPAFPGASRAPASCPASRRPCSGKTQKRACAPSSRSASRCGRGSEMTYVITDACIDVKDKTCLDACPVDCIYEGGRTLYIQPDECIDCGLCETVCPVAAIHADD